MAGFNIANFNLYNFAKRFWDMFGNPTPMDVEVPQQNSNGDIQTYLCPNMAKFKKRVWDDVGSALGQFDRTFYVDAVNSNDSNDGSLGSPFKTIKKAIDSVPVGGMGHIILQSDVELNTDVYFSNKYITIYLQNNTFTFKTKDIKDSDNTIVGTGYYNLYGYKKTSCLVFFRGTINLPSISCTGNGNQWYYQNYRVGIQCSSPDVGASYNSVVFSRCTLNIGANGYLVSGSGKGANGYPTRYTTVVKFSTTINLDSGGNNGVSINVQEEV